MVGADAAQHANVEIIPGTEILFYKDGRSTETEEALVPEPSNDKEDPLVRNPIRRDNL